MLAHLRQVAGTLKRDTLALWIAARDPRTPWLVKLLAALVAAYALSPIDLIPDVVPVLGLLDDLILVPFGIALVLRLIPDDLMAEYRAEAQRMTERPASRAAAAVVVGVWAAAAFWLVKELAG